MIRRRGFPRNWRGRIEAEKEEAEEPEKEEVVTTGKAPSPLSSREEKGKKSVGGFSG